MRTAFTYVAVLAGLFLILSQGRPELPFASRDVLGLSGPGSEAVVELPEETELVQPVFRPEPKATLPTEADGLDASAGQIPLRLFPAQPVLAELADQILQPEGDRLQSLLDDGLPGMASSNPPASSSSSAWPDWLNRLVVHVGSGSTIEPRAMLAQGVPGWALFATAERELPGHPFESVPVDPRLYFPLLPDGSSQGRMQSLGDDPLIGFYNSHAFESYVSEMAQRPERLADIISDDNGRNVVLVARELARLLSETHGIATVHSSAHHHLQGYSWSYVHSRLTAQRLLEEFPTVRVLVDVHRDSDGRDKTVATINGQTVARVRLVVGRGQPSTGLDNPHYEQTRALAEEVMAVMEQKYPGLARDIYEQDARFNQDIIAGCMLLEIGGPENTMDEALRTAALLADVLQEVLRTGQVPG